MDRVKKNKKKGFTLVELMIVVVIMVILAAAATPIFKGYLDRAKQAKYLAECRTVYVASSTIAQDFAISDQTVPTKVTIDVDTEPQALASNDTAPDAVWDDGVFAQNVMELANMAKLSADEKYEITLTAAGNVVNIVYTAPNGTRTTFTPNENVVVGPSTAPTAPTT